MNFLNLNDFQNARYFSKYIDISKFLYHKRILHRVLAHLKIAMEYDSTVLDKKISIYYSTCRICDICL